MKMLIDIPEEDYETLKEVNELGGEWKTDIASRNMKAIANGTPLPKGHGRLIDESDLMPDSDYEDGLFYAVSIGQINGAPTIIEADKESEEW